MEISTFCCLGDSITSDQVTGIGTLVGQLLGAKRCMNAACGFATCSDWHRGRTSLTPLTLEIPQNTNTADNTLSNQVRRVLQALTPPGEIIRWRAAGREEALPAAVGLGTGTLGPVDVFYLAVGTNDGNQPENAFTDAGTEDVLAAPYAALDRCGYASALRWAIETLHAACPKAEIFVATPLQACTDAPWMSHATGLRKRAVTLRVARACGVHAIDSFMDSGFDEQVARDHGEVHPDEEWKERIAHFVAERITSALSMRECP